LGENNMPGCTNCNGKCHTGTRKARLKKVKVKILKPGVQMPKYATKGSSGFDLRAVGDYTLRSGETGVIIPTGLAFEIPNNYEMQIRPRSGKSSKTSVRVANAPGTIDSDYRGEVCIIVDNIGPNPITIKDGEKIAQGVICPILQVSLVEHDDLSSTDRGSGGFGSTDN
jgi:dUTP pyrophosphatase